MHLVILALVQGITEFLPISSSGHLILAHKTLGQHLEPQAWTDILMIDVAVHVGTLGSVLVYFWRDLVKMCGGLRDMAQFKFSSPGGLLNVKILISSVPVIVVGFVLYQMELSILRGIEITAWMTLIFGVILWVVDRANLPQKSFESLSFKDAVLIGLAQSLALIPGTSRSGVTMTAARALGYSRTDAARYSLLLAIVAISGAGVLAGLDVAQSGNARLGLDAVIAALLSFIAGWVSIAVMMKWLERFSFVPFVIYRILLGGGLLIALYSGVL